MIHQYKLNGYNIVLDVCSGAVHAVDEIAYDIIALFENNDKNFVVSEIAKKYPELSNSEIEECYNQVLSLKQNGQLFTEDTFENMAGEFLKVGRWHGLD